MSITRTIAGSAPLALAASLVLAATPAAAQDDPAPTPSPQTVIESRAAIESPHSTTGPAGVSPVTPSGRPDLYLDMPYFIGGFEPEIVMTRGEEHFAGLAADDPTRLRLEQMLETVGAEPMDMVSGYALVSREDLFAFVVALRVDGVEPGTLAPAYLPILIGDLVDPSQTIEELGGKQVTVVDSVGEGDEYAELFVYDEGDTIWIVQGPRDVAETTLESLPEPLTVPTILVEDQTS